MRDFLLKLQAILESFLGKAYRDVTDTGQLQFGCPRCVETYGEMELEKHNLEVNVIKGRFNCWKCSSTNDDMHGSIYRLIKLYGNEEILNEYRNAISDFKNSKLYELHFKKDDFNFGEDNIFDSSLQLPSSYRKLNKGEYAPKRVLDYLSNRGIGWDIISEYDIGYTTFDSSNKQLSNRIILPSHDIFGEINYWTGRDFTKFSGRQKYYNPQVERKDIIFDEDKIEWDADITLVEGPFDHIVVPNSIPLLGKCLKNNFRIYNQLMKLANANVNIFLDGDAKKDVLVLYKLLNQGKLRGKIRYIPVNEELDPSEIYKLYGAKGILDSLKNAYEINEVYLTQ